jgi:hypothetical protein
MLADVDMPNDTHATVLGPAIFAGWVGPVNLVMGAVYLLTMADDADAPDVPGVPDVADSPDELHAASIRVAAPATVTRSPLLDLFIAGLSCRGKHLTGANQ